MAVEQLSPVQRRIARKLRWARRLRFLLVLGVLGGIGGHVGWRWCEDQRVFTVKVIRLVECPDHLRGQAAEVLEPLLGRTLFDVRAGTADLVEALVGLPEVATAELVCRPPDVVEVALTPRVPTLAVKAETGWLSVDSSGTIVRQVSSAEDGLPKVFGLQPAVTQPGAEIAPAQLKAASECAEACRRMLGQPPATMAFGQGGALRVRTAEGQLVLLGQPLDLERKLYTYLLIRNRLTAKARYIDVAMPAAPAWRPVTAPVSTVGG